MPHTAVTYRNVLVAASLAGLAVLSGSLLGLSGSLPPATVPGWLADPLSPPDPGAATAEQVAAFFARLTPAEASALAQRFPEIVGNLDGAPAVLRYAANQIRHPLAGSRQILAFDDRADGRIVEVLGDLDTADRLVLLLPGVANDLANFDTGLGGVERRSPAWQARQLHDGIRAADPDARVAVVAWLGYDPPEGVSRDSVREDRAAAGAVALDRFIDGLLLGHPGRTAAVIGHSYGSTVAGLAAPHLSGRVTDLVAVGSPGMGVSGRAELRTAARVWECTSDGDWIRRVPGVQVLGLGHGRLPSDPEFGALTLPCANADGHDGYFAPGSPALRAMAAVAAGRPEGDPR
ncbi:alpha/beta hydrolase [Actinoplanes sp. NEAU-A12]|uniref:Alpha/beta hydrolase n=1 Tax=Actinoplanes sandaracinus TaxID=3045177 RepID=A0ABT6WRL0_9ACTN|nr:alpha/beta hydrolase [Actinoplanes sandaracinus]MDI6102376.1 alpha/beta hydrolase [Actinoplanes sandaracinus]